MAEAIRIDGLREFVRNLKKLDSDLPKSLRKGLNTAADIVVDYAKPKVPTLTGRAARSIKTASTASEVRVKAGGKQAPYYPWLDFGGRIRPYPRQVKRRPFRKDGRFLYAGLYAERDRIHAAVEAALLDAASAAGVEVD